MGRYPIDDFCRRAVALDADSEASRYIRIRQKQGKSRVTVATDIDPGLDAGELAGRIAARLDGLDPGTAWVELLRRGARGEPTTPIDTVRVQVEGEPDDGDEDPRTVGAGVAAVLAQAVRMIQSSDARAQAAQEQAWHAMHHAYSARERMLTEILSRPDDTAMTEAVSHLRSILEPLVPVIAARVLGGAMPPARQLATDDQDAKPGDELSGDELRRAALDACDVLATCYAVRPELASDQEIVDKLRPLVMAALGLPS